MAEQGCLLSSCTGNRAEGSNPSLSAAPGRGADWRRTCRIAGGSARGIPFDFRMRRQRRLPRTLRRRRAAALLASCLAVPPVLAQPTGGVDGVVVDETGGVLPGARVSLLLVERGVRREQIAGPTGRFGFAGLRPGTWLLAAAHPGFQDATPAEVVVAAGSVVEVRLRLAIAGITESVSAVSRRALDFRDSGVRETVDRPVLEELPNTRDVWNVLEQTPGVMMSKVNVGGAESGQQSLMSAAGSAWTQNQYYLNGVNVTDPGAMGASITYYSFDSFEEMEVSTAGHRAEIQTPGVFLNIVTRRGGNRFSGSGSFFYEHERFQAQNLDDSLRARGVGQANRLKRLLDGSAQLGGPLRRDRAWFYLNYSRFRVEPFLPGFFLENGEPGVDLTDLENIMGRASLRVGDRHEIGLFFFGNDKFRPYRGASLFRPRPETTLFQDSLMALGQISWSATFGASILAEARLSRLDLHFPYGQQPDREPGFSRWELNSGVWHGGSGTNTIYERDRWQASGSVTAFRDGLFGGANEFKIGFEATHNPGRTTHDLHGGIVYTHDRVRPIEVTLYNDPVATRNFTRNIGIYAQDTLVRGRVVVEMGLRADWWDAGYPDQGNQAGPWQRVFEDLGVSSRTEGTGGVVSWLGIAPRFGINYQLTGDGRTHLRFSAGRYLHQLGLSVPGYGNPNARASAKFRFDDRNFNALVDDGELDFANPLSVFIPVRNEVDPNLKQPSTDELTLGIHRELPGDVTVGLTGILRTERNLIEDTDVGVPESAWRSVPHVDPGRDFVRGTDDDVPVTLWLQDPATLGQSRFRLYNPGIGSSYRGLILEARKRYSSGWQLLASVTVSRSTGWLPGPGDQIDEGTGFPGDLFNTPNHGDLHQGRTFWDRPFIARLSGSYRLPWGFSVAASLRAHSGRPNYRSVIFTETLDGQPLPQGSTEIVVEPPGAARSPTVPLADFRLDHRLNLPGDTEFSTYLDVFNVLNLNNVVGEGSRDDSFGAVVGILPPRVARIGIRIRF